MTRAMTFMKIADSRKTPLGKAELLVHLDKQLEQLRSLLQTGGFCTVTTSAPIFIEFESPASMQWRVNVTITKTALKPSWNAIKDTVTMFAPVQVKMV